MLTSNFITRVNGKKLHSFASISDFAVIDAFNQSICEHFYCKILTKQKSLYLDDKNDTKIITNYNNDNA